MVTEAFKETLKAVKDWAETSGLMAEEFDLETLRSGMSTSLFPISDTTKVIKVDAGGVPAEWIITSEAKPNRRMAYFHGGGFTAGGLDFIRPLSEGLSKVSECSILKIDKKSENNVPPVNALLSYALTIRFSSPKTCPSSWQTFR